MFSSVDSQMRNQGCDWRRFGAAIPVAGNLACDTMDMGKKEYRELVRM